MSHIADLATVTSWIPNQNACLHWAGSEVSFPIDLANIGQEIDWGVSSSFTVMEEAKIVAFGQLIPKPGSRLHIKHAGFRGRGVGRKLMVHLVNAGYAQYAIVISLVVHSDNESAVHLYQSLGFKVSTRPPEDPRTIFTYMEHSLE